MPSDPEPQYDEHGNLFGYVVQQDDGTAAGYDETGDLVGLSVDGEWWPIDQLEAAGAIDYGDDDGGYDDRADALEQRMADLEQRASEPTYVPMYSDPPLSLEEVDADLHQQAASLERQLGRKLTLNERRNISSALTEANVAGERRPDVQAAVDQLSREGRGLLDLDHGTERQRREARQQYARELVADRDRLEAAERGDDDLTNPEPPGRGDYDLDTFEGRTQYRLDRMRGAAEPGDTYSSSDYPGDDAAIG